MFDVRDKSILPDRTRAPQLWRCHLFTIQIFHVRFINIVNIYERRRRGRGGGDEKKMCPRKVFKFLFVRNEFLLTKLVHFGSGFGLPAARAPMMCRERFSLDLQEGENCFALSYIMAENQ